MYFVLTLFSYGGGPRLRKSRKAPEKKKKSKGFSLKGMLGWGSSELEEAAPCSVSSDEDDFDGGLSLECAAAPRAEKKQSWSVSEDDIQIEQSRRLVSKAMKMNRLK